MERHKQICFIVRHSSRATKAIINNINATEYDLSRNKYEAYTHLVWNIPIQ